MNEEQKSILSVIEDYKDRVSSERADKAVREALRKSLAIKAGLPCEHGLFDPCGDSDIICLYCGATAPDSLRQGETK
jgi:hypothetical protein